MRTKFQTKTREEQKKLSTAELEAYIEAVKAETALLEAETAALLKQADEDRLKTAELKGEIKVWKIRAEELKREAEWYDITDEEMAWLMDGNYEKYWGNAIFRPDQWALKAKYAEVMGTKVDDSKYDGAHEMKSPCAWVDRKGTYHPTEIAHHDQWAWNYLVETYGKLEAGKRIASAGTAFEYLQLAGWVRIMSWKDMDTKFFLPEKMTHAQKKTVDKYCELYKLALPFKDPLF